MAELGRLVRVHAAAILLRGSFFRKLGRDGSNERLSQRALHIMCVSACGCVHSICMHSVHAATIKGHGCTKWVHNIVAFLVVIKGAVCGKVCSKLQIAIKYRPTC